MFDGINFYLVMIAKIDVGVSCIYVFTEEGYFSNRNTRSPFCSSEAVVAECDIVVVYPQERLGKFMLLGDLTFYETRVWPGKTSKVVDTNVSDVNSEVFFESNIPLVVISTKLSSFANSYFAKDVKINHVV